MLSISRDRGKGHHCWKVSIDGHDIKGGLTKGEAADLRRTLAKLPAIVKELVSRELNQAIAAIKRQRDELQ